MEHREGGNIDATSTLRRLKLVASCVSKQVAMRQLDRLREPCSAGGMKNKKFLLILVSTTAHNLVLRIQWEALQTFIRRGQA